MDMHHLCYKANSFDLIYTSHSLEHAFNYHKVLSEINRVLKDDGIVVVEIPINYETTEVDLHDFKNADNFITIFSNYVNIKEVLYKVEVKKEDNLSGTDVVRLIIRVSK